MKYKFYEAPETEVIPLAFLEDVCQGLSGNLPDYGKRTFDWEDEED